MKIVKPFVLSVVAAGLCLLGAGCASNPTVKQGFDFSRYHTFAILPLTAKGTYQDPGIVTRLRRPVTETVAATLSAKGFQQVEEAKADFLVKMLFDYLPEQGRFEERMFDLEIIDRPSNQVVWSDYHRRKTDSTLPEDVIRTMVADMLKPFPPKGK